MFHLSRKTLWLFVPLVVAIATPATAQITISFESTVTSSTEPVARFGDTMAVPPLPQVPIVITVDTDGSGNVDPSGTAITSANTAISDGWSVTGSSALGIDQLISFSALKRGSGLVYQRVFEGIGTNGGNSGRMDEVDEFLDFELDLSSVPSDLQFQLVQIGFANTNSQGVNDPDLIEEEGTSYDPDIVITDFGGITTVFENIRNGGGMGPVSAGVFDIEVGDVVLGGGSTSIFSFSQSEDPRDFPIDGEDIDSRDSGYSLASITFDFVSSPPSVGGDFNGDGFVGQGDLDLVLLNWGDTVPPDPIPAGWVNDQPTGGTIIGQSFLDKVLLNWGDGTPPIAAQVPEPASATILMILVAATATATRLRTS